MTQTILEGVGKKVRLAYQKGEIQEPTVISLYNRNKKEADSFSIYGYKDDEIRKMMLDTHNPLLKQKLQECIELRKGLAQKSAQQNTLNLEKLDGFLVDACGIGLRKVIKKLKRLSKMTKDPEVTLILMLLETEFANLSAKRHKKKDVKAKIYARKTKLIFQMAEYLEFLGWKYGINDEAGKNANYLVYVYLPNGEQLTWHCNEYMIYECYPYINDEWDGQVCMTMEKIVTYINNTYFVHSCAA